MTDIVWGDPLQGGETNPVIVGAGWAYKVSPDGTRRLVPHSIRGDGTWNTGLLLRRDDLVPTEAAGYIPTTGQIDGDEYFRLVVTAEEGEAGLYVQYPTPNGACYLTPEAATPGTGYYRIRRILGSHALRYLDENPLAAMRLSDPSQTRIHTISYELTDVERTQAANNDYQIRGTIGFLWRLIESLRIMPTGSLELEVAWRAREAMIDGLLAPFCDMCDGAGLSYRTIRKHPHEDWQRYQLAGLRISSDRAFNTVGLPQHGVVTDAAHNADLRNFQAAADWAAEGFPDDDYSAPVFGTTAQVHASASTPKLPIFIGTHALEMNYVAHALRKLYLGHDDALYPAALIHTGVYRNFCAMNLLTMLDERNLNQAFITGLIANAVFVPLITQVAALNNNYGTIVNAFTGMFPQMGYDGGTFAGVYYTDGPLLNGFSGPWSDPAERDRRLDIVDAILGDATARA